MMTQLSTTSVDILKAVSKHPGKCATELSDLVGRKVPLQYISALLKSGLIEVSSSESKPMSNGRPREMYLYSITVSGAMKLKGVVEKESRPKFPQGRVRYHTPGPTSQIALTGSRPGAGVQSDGTRAVRPDDACSVATGREKVHGYKPYVPPKPTGRGYVERPIRNIANM